jgi:Spy/CpxP family protein refolding chaperone
MNSSRAIFGVVLVFVLGILCGILATKLMYRYHTESIFSGRAGSREEVIVNRMDRKLDLDDRQEEQIRTIIHETHEAIKTLHNQLRPQTQAIIEMAQAKIRVILTPEQREKYEQMIAERKEKRLEKGL